MPVHEALLAELCLSEICQGPICDSGRVTRDSDRAALICNICNYLSNAYPHSGNQS